MLVGEAHYGQGEKLEFLVDIVHPADVLFFLRPIRMLQERGHHVQVVSRHKDVACRLLDNFGIAHAPISTQGRGLVGLGVELVWRDLSLLMRTLKSRPNLMLGFGGLAISHVGCLSGIPSLVVYDSENARLQTRLAWPFLTHLIVPEDYGGSLPPGKAERLPGIKDLSYFHPSAFQPNRDKAISLGLDPHRPNVFVRTVRWGANHDVGKAGWTNDEAKTLVDALSPQARVHVCAEGLPLESLTPYLWHGEPSEVHHLLGCCDAYVGESATMACEAAAMGVPAIYAGVDLPGYVLGMDRRGLIRWLSPDRRRELGRATMSLLASRELFREEHRRWLRGVPDWAVVLTERAEAMAVRASGRRPYG